MRISDGSSDVCSSDLKGLSFTKQSGSDLPAGYLYADGERRYVFLGARQDAPGDVSLGYGVDPERDVAGVVERVGPFRWRLVAPRDGGQGSDGIGSVSGRERVCQSV